MENTKKYFYGKELTAREVEENRISYRTLASYFDAVLCNSIPEVDGTIFENIISGSLCNYYDENDNEITEEEYYEKYDNNEEVYERETEVYQWYIVSDNSLDLLKEANELILYSEKLDCYIWCVTHWGTSWDYVNTSIKVDENKD